MFFFTGEKGLTDVSTRQVTFAAVSSPEAANNYEDFDKSDTCRHAYIHAFMSVHRYVQLLTFGYGKLIFPAFIALCLCSYFVSVCGYSVLVELLNQ